MAQKGLGVTRTLSSPEPSNSQDSGPGVIVELCKDLNDEKRSNLFFPARQDGYLAEEICQEICRKLNIGAYTFHIFGLATTDLKIWLSPSHLITFQSNDVYKYSFRVRFKPHENNFVRIINVSQQTFDYYFLQCREDFLKDHLKDSLDDVKQNDILGLAIMDMLRFSKEYNIDYSGMKKYEPDQFLPPSAVHAFRMPLSKHRLESSFKNKLKKEFVEAERDGSSVPDIKWSYMRALWKYVSIEGKDKAVKDLYGAEHFPLSFGDEVVVDPHHPTYPGIYTRCKSKPLPEHFCKIEDLVDVSILGETGGPGQYYVQVNRTSGIPQHFMFGSSKLAMSFASCLDGYYRLIVDYHQHVCAKIHSHMLKYMKELRCHGPVDNGWAVRRLRQKNEEMPKEKYNYLLKQRRDDLDAFRLVLLAPPDKLPPCIAINRISDGQYQLALPFEEIFPSVKQLLAYYSSGKHPTIKLERILRPTRPYDNSLFLCREILREGENGAHKKRQKKEPIFLVHGVNYVETNISAGQFTELHKAILERESSESKENSVQIVISKSLALQYKEVREMLQDFTAGLQKAAAWNHSTIMSVHAIYMGYPFQILLEYAELGSMESYLFEPQAEIKISHLIVAAEQLAQALCYLQEDHPTCEWHGNIRSRNVLVLRHTPLEGFQVKLADPGLIYFYKRQPLSHPLNLERLPWIPPENYDDLSQPTVYGDRYAFGITLWEMFTCGERPFLKVPPEKVIDIIKHGGQLECPSQCPPEVYEVMKNCWHLEADTRTSPMEMVRLIRSVLCRAEDKSVTRGNVNNVYSLELSEALMMPVEKPAKQNPNGFVALPPRNENLGHSGGKKKLGMVPLHLSTSPEIASPTVEKMKFFPANLGSIGNLSDTGNSQTPLLRNLNDSPLTVSPSSPGWSASTSACSQHTTSTQLLDDEQAIDSNIPMANFTPRRESAAKEIKAPSSSSGIQTRQLPELPSYIIHSSKLFVCDDKELGSGFYGEVYQGLLNSDQVKQVAVKRLRPEMYHKYQQEFDNEFRTMIRVQHENCVRIIGQCINKDKDNPMLLVMEFVKKGCLLAFLRHNAKQLRDMKQKLLRFATEICAGMTYLAKEKIVHRDLAARNVLVTDDDRMKISDFGLSRVLGMDRDYYRCGTSKEIPIKWCAPEAIEYRMFSEKSDIWSYGITLWEVFTLGESPRLCTDDHNLMQYLKNGKRLHQPEGCSEKLYAIMMHCWKYEADCRPFFKEIHDQLMTITD